MYGLELADLTGDGQVNGDDLDIVLNHFGDVLQAATSEAIAVTGALSAEPTTDSPGAAPANPVGHGNLSLLVGPLPAELAGQITASPQPFSSPERRPSISVPIRRTRPFARADQAHASAARRRVRIDSVFAERRRVHPRAARSRHRLFADDLMDPTQRNHRAARWGAAADLALDKELTWLD